MGRSDESHSPWPIRTLSIVLTRDRLTHSQNPTEFSTRALDARERALVASTGNADLQYLRFLCHLRFTSPEYYYSGTIRYVPTRTRREVYGRLRRPRSVRHRSTRALSKVQQRRLAYRRHSQVVQHHLDEEEAGPDDLVGLALDDCGQELALSAVGALARTYDPTTGTRVAFRSLLITPVLYSSPICSLESAKRPTRYFSWRFRRRKDRPKNPTDARLTHSQTPHGESSTEFLDTLAPTRERARGLFVLAVTAVHEGAAGGEAQERALPLGRDVHLLPLLRVERRREFVLVPRVLVLDEGLGLRFSLF